MKKPAAHWLNYLKRGCAIEKLQTTGLATFRAFGQILCPNEGLGFRDRCCGSLGRPFRGIRNEPEVLETSRASLGCRFRGARDRSRGPRGRFQVCQLDQVNFRKTNVFQYVFCSTSRGRSRAPRINPRDAGSGPITARAGFGVPGPAPRSSRPASGILRSVP